MERDGGSVSVTFTDTQTQTVTGTGTDRPVLNQLTHRAAWVGGACSLALVATRATHESTRPHAQVYSSSDRLFYQIGLIIRGVIAKWTKDMDLDAVGRQFVPLFAWRRPSVNTSGCRSRTVVIMKVFSPAAAVGACLRNEREYPHLDFDRMTSFRIRFDAHYEDSWIPRPFYLFPPCPTACPCEAARCAAAPLSASAAATSGGRQVQAQPPLKLSA